MTPAAGYNEEDVALAGEYVLGLLTEQERRTFEARLVSEAPLRQLVLEWDEALAPLADAVPAVEPPAMARARIEARLFGAPQRRRWFRPWVGGLVGAALAALVVVAVLLVDPTRPVLPTHTAQVAAEDASLQVAVSLNAKTGAVELTRLAGAAPPGRVLELWLIAEGADAPVSLGLLADDDTTRLTLAGPLRDRLSGAVLAVSEEPPGGSPTGVPTGEVLAAGAVIEAQDT